MDNISFELYDIRGNMVKWGEFRKTDFYPKLDVSKIKKGIYFLKVFNRDIDEVHQIIVE